MALPGLPCPFSVASRKQQENGNWQKMEMEHSPSSPCQAHVGSDWHPRWFSGKESACQGRRYKKCWFYPGVGKIPWSSVQLLSHVWLFQLHGLQHARLLCPSPTPTCSNSCPLGQWCHPTISSSVICFSFCLQSFQASGSFAMSQFFKSGDQSIRASASALVLPVNIQDWFPLGLTGWISLLSKGLPRVFSNTTVQKHQFFSIQPSL